MSTELATSTIMIGMPVTVDDKVLLRKFASFYGKNSIEDYLSFVLYRGIGSDEMIINEAEKNQYCMAGMEEEARQAEMDRLQLEVIYEEDGA